MPITKLHPGFAALVCLLFLFVFSYGVTPPELDSVIRQIGVIVCTSGCAFFVTFTLFQDRKKS